MGRPNLFPIPMKSPLIAFLAVVLISIPACSKPGRTPALEGAWLGEGEFSASAGSVTVKAQLEILKDGTYRYLILEPRILALTGAESGTWSRDGQSLVLQPVNEKAEATETGTSVFGKLRESSPQDLRVKKMSIAGDLGSLTLSDGPMDIVFQPNPAATGENE